MRWIMSLVAVVALAWSATCWMRHAKAIQAAIHSQSQVGLAGIGLGGIGVETHGRDVLLRGTVDSPASRQLAETTIRSVDGVRAIDNRLDVISTPPARFELGAVDGTTVLRGTVADEESRDAIVARAQTLFGASHVRDELTIDPAASNDWAAVLPGGLEALKDAGVDGQRIVLAIEGNTLKLRGVVPTSEARGRVAQAARSAFPSLTIENGIRIIAPTEALSQLSLENIEFETGSARLTARGVEVVERARVALRDIPGRVEVSGHTDSLGNAESNLQLSRLRARTVVDFLSQTLPRERFVAVGYGAARPIADNGTVDGRRKNRRIEFRPLEKEIGQ